jgi:hypothetical protein
LLETPSTITDLEGWRFVALSDEGVDERALLIDPADPVSGACSSSSRHHDAAIVQVGNWWSSLWHRRGGDLPVREKIRLPPCIETKSVVIMLIGGWQFYRRRRRSPGPPRPERTRCCAMVF